MQDVASGLSAARSEVEAACRSLVQATPEALTASEEAFRRVAETLRNGKVAWNWSSAGDAARAEASRLQAGVSRAARLVSSGSRHCAVRLQILSTVAGGYTPRGDAVSLSGAEQVSLVG